jgi:hypothetical protein
MAKIQQLEHGKYLIKCGKLGEVWTARAFPKPPSKTKGMVAEATGTSFDTAVDALQEKLKREHSERESRRRWDEEANFSVPLPEEYTAAIRQTKLSDAQIAMLKAHALAGDEGLTSGELARAGGYPNYETANSIYGKCGRAIAEYMGIEPPLASKRAGDVATGALAWEGKPRTDTDHFVWIMYPELREALSKTL